MSLPDCDNNLSNIQASIQVIKASTVANDIKLANGDDKLTKISAKIQQNQLKSSTAGDTGLRSSAVLGVTFRIKTVMALVASFIGISVIAANTVLGPVGVVCLGAIIGGIVLYMINGEEKYVNIGDQTFEKVECGGGGDCCFRSIAEAIGYGKDDYMKVREKLAQKEIEMAERKDKLPESLRYILKGVYGIDPEDDESCREVLKQHAENITNKKGKWGELIDVCFVPQLDVLNNKRVFAFRELSSKKDESIFRYYAGDDKCNGLSEDIKPEKGDVVLLNINNAHWQMLKLKE